MGMGRCCNAHYPKHGLHLLRRLWCLIPKSGLQKPHTPHSPASPRSKNLRCGGCIMGCVRFFCVCYKSQPRPHHANPETKTWPSGPERSLDLYDGGAGETCNASREDWLQNCMVLLRSRREPSHVFNCEHASLLPLLHHFHKHLLRNMHASICEHLFLSFLLLLTEFHLSRNVTTIQLRRHILLHCRE